MALYFLLGFAAFLFMELVAWSNHRYIMHGLMWNWHKDHPRRDSKKGAMPLSTESKKFEKNDRFLIMYATPAIRPKTKRNFHIYGLLVFPKRFIKQ